MTTDAERARAQRLADMLEKYRIERNISRVEALLLVYRHMIYKALLAFANPTPGGELLERVAAAIESMMRVSGWQPPTAALSAVDWQPIDSAPYACHVQACLFDEAAGEWHYAIVASPPSRPFVRWKPLDPPPADPFPPLEGEGK